MTGCPRAQRVRLTTSLSDLQLCKQSVDTNWRVNDRRSSYQKVTRVITELPDATSYCKGYLTAGQDERVYLVESCDDSP
jgi:ABC-type antimicrobial peptide transport system ATPase subunit